MYKTGWHSRTPHIRYLNNCIQRGSFIQHGSDAVQSSICISVAREILVITSRYDDQTQASLTTGQANLTRLQAFSSVAQQAGKIFQKSHGRLSLVDDYYQPIINKLENGLYFKNHMID